MPQTLIALRSTPELWALCGTIFLAGFAGGFLWKTDTKTPDDFPYMTREGGYTFINPLLICGISEDEEYKGFSSLKDTLKTVVDTLRAEGKVKRIGIYFRDMNYGTWTGLNSTEKFIPASLMKVPLYVGYLKESEEHASLLSSTLLLPAAHDQNTLEMIKPTHPLLVGARYRVETLLDAMIRFSDNNAATLLNTFVATSSINDVYGQLGMPPADANTETVSPKEYFRIFRVLYNASYLPRDLSQQALAELSATDFTEGILAGLPAGRTVSHKFGERAVLAPVASTGTSVINKQELHDCGIVYYPQSPYGLCIMTEGSSITDLEEVIGQISKRVYQEVDAGLLKH